MIEICLLDQLPDDEPIRIDAPEGLPAPLLLVKIADTVYCLDDVCSHQEAPLSDGYIEDSAVRCPVHQVLFDLRTGEPDGPPARTAVRTHPVKVVDATVYLDVGPIGA